MGGKSAGGAVEMVEAGVCVRMGSLFIGCLACASAGVAAANTWVLSEKIANTASESVARFMAKS